MANQRVLVIGDKKTMVDAAIKLGVEVWWAQRPEDASADAGPPADLTLLVDYTEDTFVDLATDLHRIRPCTKREAFLTMVRIHHYRLFFEIKRVAR